MDHFKLKTFPPLPMPTFTVLHQYQYVAVWYVAIVNFKPINVQNFFKLVILLCYRFCCSSMIYFSLSYQSISTLLVSTSQFLSPVRKKSRNNEGTLKIPTLLEIINHVLFDFSGHLILWIYGINCHTCTLKSYLSTKIIWLRWVTTHCV